MGAITLFFCVPNKPNLVEPLLSLNGHRVFVSSLCTNPNPKIEGYLNMAVGNGMCRDLGPRSDR